MRANPIVATVDLARDGVQHGYLRLPYSRDDSAWGSVLIPITVVKSGAGPTALLTGANHGDEYEGPVALFDLASRLTAEEIAGRVIIVPAMNYPAFRAGSRTSPIDRGNLNRAFPGKPDGAVTEKIADYFHRTLVPLADVALDIHSGGKTLEFLPFAACHVLDDKVQEGRCAAAVEAFNAPYSMRLREIDSMGMYDSSVEEQGKVFISTELGGGGTTTALSAWTAKRGVRNFLIHAGILKGELQRGASQWLDMPSGDCFVFAEHDGLIEPAVDLGGKARKGDVLVRVWPVERCGVGPAEYKARMDGILSARHFPGLAKAGDCLAVLAVPI